MFKYERGLCLVMLKFNSKGEVFGYVRKNFSRGSKLVLVRGSRVNKPVKKYSDFDIEVHGSCLKKPYYEIVFVKKKPVLVSIYFYKYKKGKKVRSPRNVKVLYGNYNNSIKPDFSKGTYSHKQKIKRECQLVIDFIFKYLRSGDKKYLWYVQKRIK